MKILDPLDVRDQRRDIASVLMGIASQENCDGEPYDQMAEAAEYIRRLEAVAYPMARLARNTDGLHPSTAGPAMGRTAPA